jgi:HSP20 family protein
MRRLSEDMDRLAEGFFGRGLAAWPGWSGALSESTQWPELEVSREGNKLVVQADIPGLKKEDVRVEMWDGKLCISGERKSESERSEGGFFRTERSYGSFCRTIPLPEGAAMDSATAKFENGVLRVEVELPEETNRGRRIEVH